MVRQRVASSNVASIGYDASASALEVEFHSGAIYQYFGVPAHIHGALMRSVSKGSFLADHVKDQYRYLRVR